MKTWPSITIVSKSTQVLPRLYTRNHALIPKRRVLWKQTTHTPYDVDPGVYVLQIDLTPQTTFHLQNSNCFMLSLIPLVYFCNRSSTLPQTQRKILSTAKLFSTELLTPSFSVATPLWPSVGVKPNTWKK